MSRKGESSWCRRSLSAITGLMIAVTLIPSTPAHGFGTINGAGQRAEHENMTRAALACPPGVKSNPAGDCFEPRSIDQLAGHAGTGGAVGAPDLGTEFFAPAAHCDDADFLNVPGYPRTRAQATAQLQACVDRARGNFTTGRDAAAALLKADDTLDGKQVDLTKDCTFFGGIGGRAKCNVFDGLGRALHATEDFYSHSNWADEADPTKAVSIDNPPGLNLPGPSPLLNLRGTGAIGPVPIDLSTGFFKGILSDVCPGVDNRITHKCLNKDLELVNPTTGVVADPQTARGKVKTNAQKAVTAAIEDTRKQWRDFRDELLAHYGPVKGKRMINALTQDVPKLDLVFTIDTTGSMSDDIAAVQAAAINITDHLSSDDDLTDYRVALVDYKDLYSSCPSDGYASRPDLPFSTESDKPAIFAAINALGASGGCDFPESVYSGLMTAIGLPWRDGAKKAIILMGDAPPHDPEPTTGFTLASVAAAAKAVDPAEIFSIEISGGAGSFFEDLSTATGGMHFDASSASGVVPAILSAIGSIGTEPIANAGGPYTGGAGETITFDGSASFDPGGVITKYEWDFQSDGTFDVTSTNPTTTHVFTTPFTGTVTLRVTDDHAKTALGMASVVITGATNRPPNCTAVHADKTSLWPPNHNLVDTTLTGATDPDPGDSAALVVTGVTQDEPTSGAGDTGPDAKLTTPSSNRVGLRAERDERGDGRVYHVAFTATDKHGLTCTGSVNIGVPDKKNSTAIDSVPTSFDSTQVTIPSTHHTSTGIPCTRVGTDGPDVLYGSRGRDVICGLGGDDILYGRDGDDIIDGGLGNDTIYGGRGKDTLYGNRGADNLWGGAGADALNGGLDNDSLYGEGGNDRLYGGGGSDRLLGGTGSDVLNGFSGNDFLKGNDGSDELLGGNGPDGIYGENGNDVLRGDAGDDRVIGGNGIDWCNGGSGHNTFQTCETIS